DAAQLAGATMPMVVAAASNLEQLQQKGVVANQAHPGGNVTGIISNPLSLFGKRVQLLKEAVPGLSTIGVFWRPVSNQQAQFDAAQEGARSLGLRVVSMETWGPDEFYAAFRTAA